MKVTISRLADIMQFIESLTAKGIVGAEPIFTYLAELSDNFITALRNGLTIEENVSSLVKTVTLKHNVSQNVSFDLKKTPKHVIATKVLPFSTAVDAFNWELTLSGEMRVRAAFYGAPLGEQTVTLVILY